MTGENRKYLSEHYCLRKEINYLTTHRRILAGCQQDQQRIVHQCIANSVVSDNRALPYLERATSVEDMSSYSLKANSGNTEQANLRTQTLFSDTTQGALHQDDSGAKLSTGQRTARNPSISRPLSQLQWQGQMETPSLTVTTLTKTTSCGLTEKLIFCERQALQPSTSSTIHVVHTMYVMYMTVHVLVGLRMLAPGHTYVACGRVGPGNTAWFHENVQSTFT